MVARPNPPSFSPSPSSPSKLMEMLMNLNRFSMRTLLPPRWRRAALLVAGIAATLTGLGGLGGCASNNDLIESGRALQESNNRLTAENTQLRADLSACQGELVGLRKANADMRALLDQLNAENGNLKDLLARYDSELKGIKLIALDPDTDAALRELAAQYPDLLEYDAVRGMLRFKSDFTFNSGSDVVSDAGKRSIDALSRILNASAAMAYDIRIVGHTDSQPIGKSKNLHPTNWHLSTHRAISVGREMMSMGVEAARIEAAGRGEFDPMVPNNANGNTSQNRRVEVFLTKGYRRTPGAAAPTPEAPRHNNSGTRRDDDQIK